MGDDVFCKIISGAIAQEPLYRDDTVIVINDIHPQAPVHLLVIPVQHVDSIADADEMLVGHMLKAAHTAAAKAGLSGYRLIINDGEDGGKVVPHLHVHVLGGRKLGPKIVAE